MPYVAPAFKKSAFNCPHCDAYSRMIWYQLKYQDYQGYLPDTPIHMAHCAHCEKVSFWYEFDHPEEQEAVEGRMIIPDETIAPLPHPDMPELVKSDYEEARTISSQSARGAAALLRLSIQKLCVHLGEKGKNINEDIGALVKKGLPQEIQQALDIVRVIGNNAVHPGELSSDDVAEVAATLFELVNHIVEDRISRPKKLGNLFQSLPKGALAGIKKRDS